MKRTQQLLKDLKAAGADSFLVNVIQTHHSTPNRKLRGLLALIQDGKDVRIGQYSIDTLLVDGEKENWTLLDVWGTPASV